MRWALASSYEKFNAAGKEGGRSIFQSTFGAGGGGACGSSPAAFTLAFLGLEGPFLVALVFLEGLSSKSDPELDCSCAAFRLTPRFEGDGAGLTAFTALLTVSTTLRVRGGIFRSLESG
jgi:hypothetical protein